MVVAIVIVIWLALLALGLEFGRRLAIKRSFSDELRSPRLSSTPFFCVDSQKG